MAANDISGSPQRNRVAILTERDWLMYRMRVTGKSLAEIAAAFPNARTGKPLAVSRVSEILKAAMQAKRADMTDGLIEWRQEQRVEALAKLEEAERRVWKVIDTRHLMVSAGGLVLAPVLDELGNPVPVIDEDTGEQAINDRGEPQWRLRDPMEDDSHVLAAVNGALDKIWKARAALLGLNEPAKIEATVATYNYQVNGIDPSELT